MDDWIEETLHASFRMRLKVARVLHEGRSESQHLAIIENPAFGRVLYLDGALQTTERDEFIYHEMLAHVPVLAHGRVLRVLVLGGGDGGLVEEVLKHRTVERVTMVEIDPGVVELSRRFLPSICKDAFDDPRLELVFADGAGFVQGAEQRWDVLIIDSTDPVGPGEALFTGEFYRACKGVLAPGGIMVTQNGVPFVQGDELRRSMAALSGLFADATCYLATVPMYVGGPLAFGWACDDPGTRRTSVAVLRGRYAASGIETQYYTPEVHAAAFALPGYVAALLP